MNAMGKLISWFKRRDIIEVIAIDCDKDTISFRKPKWHVKLVVAWHYFLVGVFVDREKYKVYVFPIPCVGIVVFWG